jgi:2-polyprenyl-6-hydroxyphenyl methylase / 3-demethylubiquinone-9 3-methyltransferase
VFVSTINRNPKSFLMMIVGAEYLMKMVPKGTHDHKKFITPAELCRMGEAAGLLVRDMSGVHYSPLTGHFKLGANVDVNYMVEFVRPELG